MKIKVSCAVEDKLDWLVALASNVPVIIVPNNRYPHIIRLTNNVNFCPSSNWLQGGPIIENERITAHAESDSWVAAPQSYEFTQSGTSLLIAAMRCFVVTKLGEEVEIPNELT